MFDRLTMQGDQQTKATFGTPQVSQKRVQKNLGEYIRPLWCLGKYEIQLNQSLPFCSASSSLRRESLYKSSQNMNRTAVQTSDIDHKLAKIQLPLPRFHLTDKRLRLTKP